MEIKRMVEGTARKVARYDISTPTQGEGSVTRQDIQRRLVNRAEEFAHARHYTGQGRFQQIDYEKAVSELSPEERAIERGFTVREPSQQQRASKHLAERIRHFAQQGHTPADAISRATEEHKRSGLGHISLPRNSPWAAQGQQEQQNEVRRFAKLHSTSVYPTHHGEAALTGADLLPVKVAASVMQRSGATPNQIEIGWLSDWWEVNQPAPRPAPQADPRILDEYNTARLRFVEDVCKEAAAILRDPVKRNQIAPAKLW